MNWELIAALAVAVPVILFPAAFVSFINIGGIMAAVKAARARKANLLPAVVK